MEEELNQIDKNETWELVPRPTDKNVIKTKWVFKNKMNEDGKVIINKARLVYKEYSQREGVGTGADPGFNSTTTHQKNPNYRPFQKHLRSR
jgi:hypothetical protein